jgi:hypothetical protein
MDKYKLTEDQQVKVHDKFTHILKFIFSTALIGVLLKITILLVSNFSPDQTAIHSSFELLAHYKTAIPAVFSLFTVGIFYLSLAIALDGADVIMYLRELVVIPLFKLIAHLFSMIAAIALCFWLVEDNRLAHALPAIFVILFTTCTAFLCELVDLFFAKYSTDFQAWLKTLTPFMRKVVKSSVFAAAIFLMWASYQDAVVNFIKAPGH